MTAFGPVVTLMTRDDVTGQDSDGNDIRAVVAASVQAISFSPGGSTETLANGDTVVTKPILTLPPGTDVTAVDQIVVDGTTYEVVGSPNQPISPWTGWNPGVAVNLEAVTG